MNTEIQLALLICLNYYPIKIPIPIQIQQPRCAPSDKLEKPIWSGRASLLLKLSSATY